MTIWYRAHRSDSRADVFSGMGGIHVSARWNYVGNKVIYCSASISLCTLEWLAHNGLSVSGFSYYRYSICVPDDLVFKPLNTQLPENWDAVPATDLTRDFAQEHLFSSSSYLALAIPSVVVPEEYNLVINPMHPKFVKVSKTIKNLGEYAVPKR